MNTSATREEVRGPGLLKKIDTSLRSRDKDSRRLEIQLVLLFLREDQQCKENMRGCALSRR